MVDFLGVEGIFGGDFGLFLSIRKVVKTLKNKASTEVVSEVILVVNLDFKLGMWIEQIYPFGVK